jgi:proteic killer suppression protein
MIRTFKDKETEALFRRARVRRFDGILRQALRRLDILDAATSLDVLRALPSNRLHALERDRKGQWSIAINDQWRICFRFENGDAYDVEIVDYH